MQRIGRAIPTLQQIRQAAQGQLNQTPCLWQLQIGEALLKADKDVVCITATGDGKTLTFWLPLLFSEDGIVLVVTPLNQLGKQTEAQLGTSGVSCIAVESKTATPEKFKAIRSLEHRVVVANPELLMKDDGSFEALLRDPKFNSKLLAVVIDEAHCVSEWGGFRDEYRYIGRLRHLLPSSVPFYAASATMPPEILADVKKSLNLRTSNTFLMHRSNDRPNIHLVSRPFKYGQHTYSDLDFLVKDWKPGDASPPKFLIFFDSIKESEDAANHLRSLLPKEYQDKIKWFHAVMTPEFRDIEVGRFREADSWGYCATDSFGMGMDLSDILLIIQWKASTSYLKIWQRIGRAARDQSLEGTAIIFSETQYSDEKRAQKEATQQKRAETLKRKAEVASRSTGGAETANGQIEPTVRMDVEARRASYAPSVVAKIQKATKGGDRLHPVLDDMINARARGINCIRLPFTLAFENDKIGT
ncbi:hypothetical protein JAAARDRAFT_690571 [Jaapia argillacea MUCL 33604]|uniref:DNA 3'-5' helicase n=1 Tax=Jaapia argillacea MUCL 33604 TaxID=933084 RepID=A0A067PRG5_9AGAM|nr:hypothetical protein JAAARDRAFT_690571 [Jaapia argillacea MUCL 33604]